MDGHNVQHNEHVNDDTHSMACTCAWHVVRWPMCGIYYTNELQNDEQQAKQLARTRFTHNGDNTNAIRHTHTHNNAAIVCNRARITTNV